jgi:hypothetical protein
MGEYRMDRKLSDANGPVGTDVGRGSFLFIDTDDRISGVALGGGPALRRLEPLVVGE